jgi:hypothetical protein
MRFFDANTMSIYDDRVHTEIPDSAKALSEDIYLAVFGDPPIGTILSVDSEGLPCRVLVGAQTTESSERAWRDAELSSLAWLRDRHRDQLDMSTATTLTPGQFNELLTYMQALRDWPQSEVFPDVDQRPLAPSWIAEQTQ